MVTVFGVSQRNKKACKFGLTCWLASVKLNAGRSLGSNLFYPYPQGKLMKPVLIRLISRVLLVSMLAAPFQAVQAGMIGTDQVAVQSEREAVLSAMSRPEVVSQLQSLGVDVSVAKDRVAAMTDAEVRHLAGQVDAAPAGAKLTTWSAIFLIAIAVWVYYAYGKK